MKTHSGSLDPHRTSRAAVITSALVALALLGWATPASAQISRLTSTIPLLGPPQVALMRGTDVGYDPAHNVYLVVGGYGSIFGQFVDTSGNAIGAAFRIGSASSGSPFGHFPRTQYSPDANGGAGGFLVVWHQNDAGVTNGVHGQMISYTAGIISADHLLSDLTFGSFWEAGAPLAYSVTSRRFLVGWSVVGWGVQARFVDANGVPFGSVMTFANLGSSRDPGLTWNAATDEFGLSYSGWDSSGAFVVFRKVRPSDGQLSLKSTFGFAKGTWNTDLDVNPTTGNYVIGWGTVAGSNAAEFDQNGNGLGSGLLAVGVGGEDTLDLRFNPISGTFLAVGQSSFSMEIAAAELNSHGAPLTGAIQVTTGSVSGSYYPRLAARANAPQWNISYANNLKTMTDQVIGTGTTAGGPVGTLGGAPPPPTGGGPPPPTGGGTGCSTPDPFVALGGGTCVNGGWHPPSGGTPPPPPPPPPPTGGGSTGCTTVQPGPSWTCSSAGGWLPPGSGGGTPPPPPPPPTTGCTTVQPGPGWTCQSNGGWLPPGLGGGTPPPPPPTGGGTGGCTTISPGPGWVCVGGGWLPPGTITCTTVQPGPHFICVNGGWQCPPTGCLAPSPVAANQELGIELADLGTSAPQGRTAWRDAWPLRTSQDATRSLRPSATSA